jgi:HPr kinase/phosphorylase
MTLPAEPTIHASAVLVGQQAIVIRGPSGSGKSRLAFDLIMAGHTGLIPTAVLVGDDRIHLERKGAAIVARPAQNLAGLIEVRGLGIRRIAFAEEAPVGLIVDLAADDAERLPAQSALKVAISGIEIPRIPVGRDDRALPLVVASLLTRPASVLDARSSPDCQKEFGNHISPTIATE